MLTNRLRWSLVAGAAVVSLLGVGGLFVVWLLDGWDERGLQLRLVDEVTLDGVVFEAASNVENGRGAQAYARGTLPQDIDFGTIRFGDLESDRGVGLRIDVVDPDGVAFAVLTDGLVCDGIVARHDDGGIRSSAICDGVSDEYVREHRSAYVFDGKPPTPDP